jgi:prolyl oligopeptidase
VTTRRAEPDVGVAVRQLPLWSSLRDRIEAATVPGVVRSPLPTAAALVEWSQTGEVAAITIDHGTSQSTVPLRVPGGSRLHRVWTARSGHLFVCGWLVGGTEEGVFEVVDGSGERRGGRFAFSTLTEPAWLPDDAGLFVNAPDIERTRMAIWYLNLATNEFSIEDAPTDGLFNVPQVSPTGDHVAVIVGSIQRRPAWILDRGSGSWQPFLDDGWGHCVGEFLGDEYVAVTTMDAPRGRVVAIGLAGRRVREIVAESEAVVRAVQAVDRNRLLVSEYLDAACHLRLVDLSGNELEDPPEDEPGTITPDAAAAPVIGQPMAAASATSAEFTYIHSSFRRSAGVYAYSTSTRLLRIVRKPAIINDDLTVTTESVFANDGTRLPVHIVSHSDVTADAAPTLVSVYGGFNVATLPRYLAWVHAFCSLGAKVAFPIVRGGGEYGDAWWQAALRARKQRTFDDLYTIAEHLLATGTSSALAVHGSSHGALVAAVAITQRPDLFAAAAAIAGIYDMTGFNRDPITAAIVVGEYGDPDNPVDRPALAAYSPVAHPHPDCPPAIVVAPQDDIRCPLWHAEALVGALKSAAPDQDILLRVWPNMGHAGGVAAGSPAERNAEWLAFVAKHLGLDEQHP